MNPPVRFAIVTDFDATVTVDDMGDLVSMHFAGRDTWQRAEDEFKAGSIDFATLLRKVFEPITATREEIGAFVAERAVLRPGFERLVARCRDEGRPLVVCSAGLDVYIEPVLARLPADLREHVILRANEAICSPGGMTLRFPGQGTGCGWCGSCKAPPVEELRAAGWRVIFCGDGTSDRCAANVADLVFARAKLLDWCKTNGIAARPFETFDEVSDAIAA
jgi:2-hydroxy-3-keto-5-methylthiopentenyl-1-phosphate phosphatase